MMTKHRQAKGRLGDEDIAGHQFERETGGVGDVLIVAGGDYAQTIAFHSDLRRTEDVAGGMETHARAVKFQLLSVPYGLRAAGKILAIAQAHDVECFLGRQNGTMASSRVVGVAVRDKGFVDRTGWIDMEAARLATNARRGWNKDIFGPHRA